MTGCLWQNLFCYSLKTLSPCLLYFCTLLCFALHSAALVQYPSLPNYQPIMWYFSYCSFIDNKNNSNDKFVNVTKVHSDCWWPSNICHLAKTKMTQKMYHSCICVSLLLKKMTQMKFVKHIYPQRPTTGLRLSFEPFLFIWKCIQSSLTSVHMNINCRLFRPTMWAGNYWLSVSTSKKVLL